MTRQRSRAKNYATAERKRKRGIEDGLERRVETIGFGLERVEMGLGRRRPRFRNRSMRSYAFRGSGTCNHQGSAYKSLQEPTVALTDAS